MVVFMVYAIMLMAPIMLMGGTFMALRVDVPLSGLILVLIPLLLIVVVPCNLLVTQIGEKNS